MSAENRPSTRRYLKGEQTREQIVNAAKRLFMQRGYYNTSIYDLFEKAGITKGAFYHHWKTKEDLALTILQQMREAYEQHFFPILKNERPARERIEQALHMLQEFNTNPDWVYCRLLAMWSAEMGTEEDAMAKGVQEMRHRWLEFWEQLLRSAQEQGHLRTDIPAKELSFLMLSATLGVYIAETSGRSRDSYRAVETIRRVLFT
jgi:TetR/AcrR family transcriptional repressor of nem operon